MKKGTSKASGIEGLSPDLLSQLPAAAALPDDQINTGDPDAPEVTDWSGAVRGRFYRPVKKLRSLRVDADVLAYYEAQGPGYQTRINRDLRAAMLRGLRRGKQREKQGKAPAS
jgi:uncharacterized protein (DUF4415 family)